MCTYVNAASFLALSFTVAGKTRLSFLELSKLIRQAETDLAKVDATIDWTGDSYMAAMGFYDNLFETEKDEEGVLCRSLDNLKREMHYLMDGVPRKVRTKLQLSITYSLKSKRTLV